MLKKMLLLIGLLAGMFSVQAQTWYLEDFEELGILGPNKPEGWTVSENEYGQGYFQPASQGFESDMAFNVQMVNASGDYWFYTQSCALGSQPVVEFQYKTSGVIGDAPEHCLSLELAISTDGENWTTVKTVDAADFVSSSTYTLFRGVLPESYAEISGYVRLKVIPTEDAGTVNLDIDNFGVGTKPESKTNDLMIQGELAGPSMPTVNTEAEYTFTVFNNGTAAQAAYSVQLLNGTYAVLASQDITASLEAGASAQYTLKYTPTQAGTDKLYAVVVLTGDEDPTNDTATLDIDVQAAGGIVVEVGNGKDLTYVPVGFTSKTYATLTLYSPEKLGAISGTISALIYEGKFTEEITCATQIYIGETDHESIPWDPETWEHLFIDPSNFTKVFDADMTFSVGDPQSVRFTLTQPFAYSGSKTLAVYVFTRIAAEDVLEEFTANRFYATSTMGDFTMVLAASGENIDPMQPDKAMSSPVFQRPNTKFVFSSVSDEKYNLTFAVKDAAGQAVSNAVVTLNGETQEVGKYAFEDMSARLYNYVVEKEGFVPARGVLRLSKDTTVAVTLIDMAEYPGLTGYLFEDFENIVQDKRPLNWTSSFYVDEKGGKNDGHRLTHSFWAWDGIRDITTNPIFMGSDPVFEFEYRVMEFEESTYGYTGSAFAGKNMTWSVAVSTDFGETWETLYDEDYGVHEESKNYKPFSIDVSSYAGKICQFLITVERDLLLPGEFFFDIDDLKIGTQLEKDVAVVSKIEGMRVPEAGAKNTYTVYVRNEGSEDVDGYSLKFYDGETEIGSVPGSELEGGAFAKLNFEYAFAQEGEHTLTAQCVMDGDEQELNNTTSEFYVSVQSQGVKSSMVEAYESEDMSWYAPLSVYNKNSLNWLLYNKKDLAFESGSNISGMAFRTKFAHETGRIHLSIYMGETANNSLFQGVPAPTSLTKVFDGGVTINDLDGGNLVINFDRPYPYTGKNIVMAVYAEVAQPFSYNVECGFYGQFGLGDVMVISVHEDEPIDLSATLTQQELQTYAAFCKPSTIFLLNDNVSYYSVNFEVIDQNGKEVSDATVTFDGTQLKTGQYKVENVPDGTYAYTVSLNGEEVTGSVTVNGANVTEKVQLQHVANQSNSKQTMISIYPNPTDGKLHIDMAEGAKEINLYDISGRSVRKISRVPAGVIELDMTDCHSGIYLLKIDGRAFKISKR